MSKGLKISRFFIFSLLMFISVAYSLDHIEVFGNIENSKAVINYTFMPSGEKFVKIIFEKETPKIVYLDENCTYRENFISCSLEKEKTISVELPVEKDSDKFVFEDNFRITNWTKSVTYTIALPEGAILPKNGTKFFPMSASIATDGRKLFVIWRKENLEAGELFGIKVYFEEKNQENRSFLLWIVLPLFVLLILALSFYLLFGRKKDMKQIILPVLKNDEKKVMEVVIKYPEGVNQKIIVEESGYSKAKVSKVLKSLEERGLVRLERFGRTNKVYISENFGKEEKENEENREGGS